MTRWKSLTKDERKIQIITWFAVRIQNNNKEYASSYEIARGLDMSPSSHLRAILEELVGEGRLQAQTLERQGRWQGRGYMLTDGTYQPPRKRSISINSKSRPVGQIEMF